MKIAVYGATGMVGSRIVAEALGRELEVTAVSRHHTIVPGATPFTAQLSDLDALRRLADTHDAIVFSVPPARDGGPHEDFVTAHCAIAIAAPHTRLIVIGGAGALNVGDGLLKDQPGFPEEFKPEATTMAAVLEVYRSSAAHWTMIAPSPMIAPGEHTGRLVLGGDSPVGDSVTAEDFAQAVIDELVHPKHLEARFTVATRV